MHIFQTIPQVCIVAAFRVIVNVFEIQTHRAAQSIPQVSDRVYLSIWGEGVSGYNTESLTMDHSMHRVWTGSHSLDVQNLF